MSFGPFLGGKRICLGKTFADLFLKAIVTIIAYQYEFEFVNKEHEERKPVLSIGMPEPEIKVTISKAL
jgi:cytochrome P450